MDTFPRPRAARVALFALGAWFALTAGMSYVAGANFMALRPDALPRAVDAFGPTITEPSGVDALRYLAGEINRHLFAVYGWLQLGLGLLALAASSLAGLRSRLLNVCVGLAFGAAVLFVAYLLPQIVEIGRRLDLVPKAPVTPDRTAFDALHRASVVIEVSKLLLILVATGVLVRGPRAARAGGAPE